MLLPVLRAKQIRTNYFLLTFSRKKREFSLLKSYSYYSTENMTEVRKLPNGSFGLFATKAFERGDVLLNEHPLLSFESDENIIQTQFSDSSFLNAKSSSKYALAKKMNSTQLSSSGKGKHGGNSMSSKHRIAKWRGMVSIAASYVLACQVPEKLSSEKKKELLSLYHPSSSCAPSDTEWEVVQVAESALSYCVNYAKPNSPLSAMLSDETSKMDIFKIMLIWACNAFEGGLLYKNSCRINHACDPNCITVDPKKMTSISSCTKNSISQSDQQTIKAITPIKAGDELLISYLGIFNWAGGDVRKKRLLQTKHFHCSCSRCSSEDIASAIPCPSCHPRQGPGSKYLDEQIQWDDDDNFTVSYSYPKNSSCDTTSSRCRTCNESVQFNTSPVLKIGKKVTDKVLLHIENIPERNLSTSSKMGAEELASINSEMDEQLYQLASSVLGANHWATNFMLLSLLDRMLASFNAIMLLGQDLPDMSELAEAIDSLQRLWKFSSGLQLHMNSPFFVYNQTLGIARTLVALGDVKSMKYGAEWATKVKQFINLFGGDDLKKVVSALEKAWERPTEKPSLNASDMDVDRDDSNRSKKRAKT